MPEGYKARPEQAILFTVAAWDSNCAQHIPQRFEVAEGPVTLCGIVADVDTATGKASHIERIQIRDIKE